MKTITDFDSALLYINRLGFSGGKYPGWIPEAQRRLCLVSDALYAAAGEAYPYRVKFYAHKSDEGFRYCWLGYFEVRTDQGTRYVLCDRLDRDYRSMDKSPAIVTLRPTMSSYTARYFSPG